MTDFLRWRQTETGTQAVYYMSLYAGEVERIDHPRRVLAHPWRAMIQTCPVGHEVGWYATEAEAKDALEKAVIRAIKGT